MESKLYQKHVFLNGIKNLKMAEEALKMLHVQDGPPHQEWGDLQHHWLMLQENRRLTIVKIEDIIFISYGSVEDIICNDLGYRKIAAKWIPWVLHEELMLHQVMTCQQWNRRFRKEPNFLDKVVTCDESYYPETKQ